MSSWRAFPDKGWSAIGGSSLSGFGKGVGNYQSAYAIDTSTGQFLNGRVSARLRLSGNSSLKGAGVVCRADSLGSFVAFYVTSAEQEGEDLYSVRLAGFKEGRLVDLAGLKTPIQLQTGEFHVALQFFSGEMNGEVISDGNTHRLRYTQAAIPFPGCCGVVRFYSAAVIAQMIRIERITMKPILPEDDVEAERPKYKYAVFLSYSSADKPSVLKVIEEFKRAGISYWVDHERITFGDGIVEKIEDGLRNSKYVVACLSRNYATSGWCRAEYGTILNREFSGNTSRRVIPLSLDSSKDSDDAGPLLLSDKMRAHFTDPVSMTAFLKFIRDSARQ